MPAATGSDPILLDLDGAIARIRFNRPQVLNALDRASAQALLRACETLAGAAELRAVVLSGEGKAFMAGGDLAAFNADPARAAEAADAIITPLHQALALLASIPQPVIASIHGAVAGAGVSVALACDLCIAADDTRLTLAYARIGTSPDGSATWSLPRLLGLRKAMEIVLLSEPIDAAEAVRLGLVNRVVPAAALTDETEALAHRIALGPTVAYGRSKRLLRESFERNFEAQMQAEREAFGACARTADFAEGLDAFFGKRRPDYHGR